MIGVSSIKEMSVSTGGSDTVNKFVCRLLAVSGCLYVLVVCDQYDIYWMHLLSWKITILKFLSKKYVFGQVLFLLLVFLAILTVTLLYLLLSIVIVDIYL